MLHCGGKFLKQVLNFCFKLDGIVPRYGSARKDSFLGTDGIPFFGTYGSFKKYFIDCSIIPAG